MLQKSIHTMWWVACKVVASKKFYFKYPNGNGGGIIIYNETGGLTLRNRIPNLVYMINLFLIRIIKKNRLDFKTSLIWHDHVFHMRE